MGIESYSNYLRKKLGSAELGDGVACIDEIESLMKIADSIGGYRIASALFEKEVEISNLEVNSTINEEYNEDSDINEDGFSEGSNLFEESTFVENGIQGSGVDLFGGVEDYDDGSEENYLEEGEDVQGEYANDLEDYSEDEYVEEDPWSMDGDLDLESGEFGDDEGLLEEEWGGEEEDEDYEGGFPVEGEDDEYEEEPWGVEEDEEDYKETLLEDDEFVEEEWSSNEDDEYEEEPWDNEDNYEEDVYEEEPWGSEEDEEDYAEENFSEEGWEEVSRNSLEGGTLDSMKYPKGDISFEIADKLFSMGTKVGKNVKEMVKEHKKSV